MNETLRYVIEQIVFAATIGKTWASEGDLSHTLMMLPSSQDVHGTISMNLSPEELTQNQTVDLCRICSWLYLNPEAQY